MPQLLLVEDDSAIAQGLRDNLEFEGHSVTHAADGELARTLLAEPGRYDLVILDLMLPKVSGYELLRLIRAKEPELPVLLLTARGDETDRVLGLDLGADDYVAKPFSIRELMARVRALLRRSALASSASTAGLTVLEFGAARVDFSRFEATMRGAPVDLTRKEYGLLKYLAEREGLAVTREQLLDDVWGHEARLTTRTVDNHMASLRAKVEQDSGHPAFLKTIHGVGYKFVRS
jgi:DNA-binding response OmpR family regulator